LAPTLLTHAQGVIAGTDLKVGGEIAAPIDPERVAALVRAARAAWQLDPS
jgi:predicted TIM-barrel enzyme